LLKMDGCKFCKPLNKATITLGVLEE